MRWRAIVASYPGPVEPNGNDRAWSVLIECGHTKRVVGRVGRSPKGGFVVCDECDQQDASARASQPNASAVNPDAAQPVRLPSCHRRAALARADRSATRRVAQIQPGSPKNETTTTEAKQS